MGRDGNGVEPREDSIRLSFQWNGKRHRETLTLNGQPMRPTRANIAHAQRVRAEVVERIRLGTFDLAEFFPDSRHVERAAMRASMTFGDACDAWLKTKGRLATKTRNQYRNALEVWKRLLGADKPIASLTHTFVQGKVGAHKWASNKLLNNYLITLRGVFRLAGRDIELDDPTVGIENGKVQQKAPDPLTPKEMDRVLLWLHEKAPAEICAYFQFAFATGMRPEEIIALRWSDYDEAHGTMHVERAKSAGEIKDVKTYAIRDVDLIERAVSALAVMHGRTGRAGGEIFINPKTQRPFHDERTQRDHYWTPALAALGIRHRRAYQTRHTYATNALSAGVNPSYISRQMGHESARMLFKVYAKWIDGADRGREKAKLEAALKA
jgi:integrase